MLVTDNYPIRGSDHPKETVMTHLKRTTAR